MRWENVDYLPEQITSKICIFGIAVVAAAVYCWPFFRLFMCVCVRFFHLSRACKTCTASLSRLALQLSSSRNAFYIPFASFVSLVPRRVLQHSLASLNTTRIICVKYMLLWLTNRLAHHHHHRAPIPIWYRVSAIALVRSSIKRIVPQTNDVNERTTRCTKEKNTADHRHHTCSVYYARQFVTFFSLLSARTSKTGTQWVRMEWDVCEALHTHTHIWCAHNTGVFTSLTANKKKYDYIGRFLCTGCADFIRTHSGFWVAVPFLAVSVVCFD